MADLIKRFAPCDYAASSDDVVSEAEAQEFRPAGEQVWGVGGRVQGVDCRVQGVGCRV